MILIISHEQDLHTKAVLDELRRQGAPAELLNLARFPVETRLTVALADGAAAPPRRTLTVDGRPLDLDEVRVIWWRRPQPFELDPAVSGRDDRQFAYGECHCAFAGLWLTLDRAFWINHPTRDDEAARKLHQLHLVRRLGLRAPRSCITNDPAEARAFAQAEGLTRTIYKAFSATESAWRETRLLQPAEAALLDQVAHAPVIFQEYIEAEVDLRITVVGDQIFAAAIESQATSYKVDFRMTMHEAAIHPHVLPDAVADSLRRLMAELGLVYGAIDMRLTPAGEYVFLEVNPAGQWLFVEQRTGQPITRTLAELMMAHERTLDRGMPTAPTCGDGWRRTA